MNARFHEYDYEEAFVQKFEDLGWTHFHGESLQRAQDETLLENELREYLQCRYREYAFTENELDRIVANLKNTSGPTKYLAYRACVLLIQNGFAFSRDDTSLLDVHIDYIDYDEPHTNNFMVVNQLTINEGSEERRPDVVLYINGIPVCIIELKNPADENATIHDAWEQIHVRYWRALPSLLKYCVLSCISDGAQNKLGTPFTPEEHYYAWKKVRLDDEPVRGVPSMETLIAGALSPTRILEVIRDFVFLPDVQQGNNKEIVIACRYPQYFATKKLLAHVLQHMHTSENGDGKGGTYFGATGCGKTITMLFLARQLKRRTKLNPTILIVVDREDLQKQAAGLFTQARDFLGDDTVRVIESRRDLKKELSYRPTGGLFITTVQKFCEELGELSTRENLICFSDEAHRTQVKLGSDLKVVTADKDPAKAGVFVTHGFAHFLRAAFPRATYVGFSGTPIDETLQVFGEVVDQYTMQQAVDDEITVPLMYQARLARVLLDTQKAKEIEEYYRQCEAEGTTPDKIERSKRAMASMEVILGDDERLERVAKDIADHYDSYNGEHPGVVEKAMIVTSTREIAYRLYQKLRAIRPMWFEPRRVADESKFVTPEQVAELQTYKILPAVNLVATRGANDPKEMFDLLGDKAHREMLDLEFKKDASNFRIAIVVDMWITGFDVPSLTILYNDKPLQQHTLVQTISRVNRRYPGKSQGLIVDYIGIHENMQKALKKYGGGSGGSGSTEDDVKAAYEIFASELSILRELMHGFDASDFFRTDNPMARLLCLSKAAEFVLSHNLPDEKDPGKTNDKNKLQFVTLFRGHVKRMKVAYGICKPSELLSEEEVNWAQFFMAVQGMVSKLTPGPSTSKMNAVVEKMIEEALSFSGVETVLNAQGEEALFSDKFKQELETVTLPHTKFQILVKMLRQTIKEYAKTNAVKAAEFDRMLQKIVDEYNTRDKMTFTNQVTSATIKAIWDVVEKIKDEKKSIETLGINSEEKAFYDILIDQRDKNKFEYADEKCLDLAKKIRELIEATSDYDDWMNNINVRAKLFVDMATLLYQNGYPPNWSREIFEKVLDQVKNFKKYH